MHTSFQVVLAVWGVLLLLSPPASASTTYEPQVWNQHYNITAKRVPKDMFLQVVNGGGGNNNRKLPNFPLTGYDVTLQCNGPDKPFASAAERNKAGACAYTKNADGTYDYWEKQPGEKMRNTNCYCYAGNQFKNSWCNPGVGGGVGALLDTGLNCDILAKGIIADGAKPVSRDVVKSGVDPPEGHYIAMLFRPQSSCNFAHCLPDFHFLRRDINKLWSQKVGEAPVTNLDSAGTVIKDPESAKLHGGYTEFCGYFLIIPSKIKLGTIQIADPIASKLEQWKQQGIQFSKQPLPYMPGVDDVDPELELERRLATQRSVQQGRRLLQGL
eukprot:jgi/Chrzof1/7857/Cz02g39020.t1